MKSLDRKGKIITAIAVTAITGYWLWVQSVYTLYREGFVGVGLDGSPAFSATLCIHTATFDASESGDYNSSNCDIAKHLFQEQPGVTARYWCEKGR